MAPKIPDYEQRIFEIRVLKDNTLHKYRTLLYRRKPGEIKTNIIKMVGKVTSYFIGKESDYEPIKIMGRKEIVQLARSEKKHYHDLFKEFVRIYAPGKSDHSHDIITEYAKWELLGHNLEKEIYNDVMNGNALEDDILKLIKHYSWFIAYYKYYVVRVIDHCLLYRYSQPIEIEFRGKKKLLDEQYRLELYGRRRDKFDPLSQVEKILEYF